MAAAPGGVGSVACYLLGYVGWGPPATGIAASTAAAMQASRTPGTVPRGLLPLLGSLGFSIYGRYLLQAIAFRLLPQAVVQLNPVARVATLKA